MDLIYHHRSRIRTRRRIMESRIILSANLATSFMSTPRPSMKLLV
ncbi:unnamed protein product, partial [Nezara viridula]